MEQTLNKVNITGVLVKNGLEVKNQFEENECIAGSLVIRTHDGSEHEVNYYANKYKKDENGKFTTEVSKMYTSYETIISDYTSLEIDPENADIIRCGMCEFSANDYKNQKNNMLVSGNKIRAKFANRLTEQEKEITANVATFEISGVINKMQPEIRKDIPTGNGTVIVDVIGYQGSLTPVKLTIDKSLVEAFGNAGFYEGGTGKFSGNVINIATTETVVEKQSFGEDLVYEKTIFKRLYEVKGGSPLGGLEALKITQEEYSACQSKRRLKLDEILNGTPNTPPTTGGQGDSPFTKATAPSNNNPFTGSNPFAR